MFNLVFTVTWHFPTWICEHFLCWCDINKLFLCLFLVCFRLEIIRMPLLSQLSICFYDFLFVGTPKNKWKEKHFSQTISFQCYYCRCPRKHLWPYFLHYIIKQDRSKLHCLQHWFWDIALPADPQDLVIVSLARLLEELLCSVETFTDLLVVLIKLPCLLIVFHSWKEEQRRKRELMQTKWKVSECWTTFLIFLQ